MDISEKINSFNEIASIASAFLSSKENLKIDSFQIQIALQEKNKCEAIDLLDMKYTSDGIVSSLKDYDFKSKIPTETEQIILTDGILSKDLDISTLLLEERVKIKGEIWQINKYDADPKPSNPHAHNLDTGTKLHLGNGWLYRKTKPIKQLSKKKLFKIREKVKNIELPLLEV
jgi:hypothetical protein